MTSVAGEITDPRALDVLDRLSAFGQRIVLVRDRDRETAYVSDNALAISGWSSDEFSRRLYSIIHDEDLPAVLAASRAIRHDGASEQRFAVRAAKKDGRPIEFDAHLMNRFDDPLIDGMVAVLTPMAPIVDPTNRWTALLALTDELLVIQRSDLSSSTFVSPGCEKVLGYSGDDLLRCWDEILDDDDVARMLATTDSVMATPRSEARLRLRARHADGRWLTLDATFANHQDDALIDGLLIRARDISELVHMEDELAAEASRFEAMVTNGPGATILMDERATITFCSAGIELLLGYEPSELVGRPGFHLVHPDDRVEASYQLDKLLTDPSIPDPTLRLLHADGHFEWVGITAINQLDHPALGALVLSLRNRGPEMRAEQRLNRLLRDAPGATFVITDDARVTWTTPGIERFLGEHRRMTPDVVRLLVSESDARRVTDIHRSVIEDGAGASARFLCRLGPESQRSWVDLTITNANDDSLIGGAIVNIHDVDEAVRAGESGNRLTAVLENTTDYVSIFDGELNLLWRNSAAAAVFGPAPAPVEHVLRQVPPSTLESVYQDVLPALETRGSWRGEIELGQSDGSIAPIEVTILLHDSVGGERFYSMMGRDISDRKRLESRLEARARHDQLTGLPNRLLLSERLEAMLAADRRIALLFIDLDQFKAVNDSQGHDAGDRLLVTAAARLRSSLRPTDVIARFGGDEFVVLLPDVATIDDALPLAERVLDHLRGPVQLGPVPIYLTGSAGIAIADGADATTLISNADAAMYKAKAEGRDRVAVFTAELRARSRERLETAHLLRSALDSDALEVWFQPIVETRSGRPMGVEALVRWRHRELGPIDTSHLIEVAEETGMILALGTAVISTTCEAIASLRDVAGDLAFSVNLSAHQLADPALIEALESALREHDVEPRQLLCEVTESAVMVDVAESARVLDRIRGLGVGIAIDDFGTGYSSLAYLQRFPVDVLKIDQEFVTGLSMASDWKRSLAAAVISLGHSLGLRVIAEGVEEDEQAAILGMLDCDGMQGYLYSEAVPAADLPSVLTRLRKGRRGHG